MGLDSKEAVILLSGGMDSVIAYFVHRENFDRIHAIQFDYGQRNAEAERQAVNQIWLRWGTGRLVHLRMHGHIVGDSPLLDHSRPIAEYNNADEARGAPRDSSFIPGRNAIFLSIALNWAKATFNTTRLITGLRQGSFPDSTVHFTYTMKVALEQALGEGVEINNPLQMFNRAESIRLARNLESCVEALSYSVTCFVGHPLGPCGKCLPCVKRAEGFAEVNMVDPLIYRLQKEGLIP